MICYYLGVYRIVWLKMSHRALNNLLFRFHETGLEEKLAQLLHIFKDDLPEENKARIYSIANLFDELQKCRVIHIDDLKPLKEALGFVGRQDLVENVEELERQRAEQTGPLQRYGAFLQINAIRFSKGAGSVARAAVEGAGSVARAAVGAVNLKTVIRVGAAAVVGVTVYNICTGTPPEFFDEFSTRALPHGNTLIEMSNGCLCFTVQAEDLSSLKTLWGSYQEGTLKKRLQELLLTEKIKQLANSQEVEVDVTIDEQEYKDACLDLMAARIQVSNIDEEQRRGDNVRRKSDSSVNLIPGETEFMSMALRQAESKLNFEHERILILEKEIENLSTELVEAKQSTDTKHLQITGHKAEDMEPERRAYVQRYVENLQHRHSVTSETTDSGLGTHSAAPSVLGTVEDSDVSDEPRFRDLSGDVIKELSGRLDNDREAWRNVYVALHLTGHDRATVTLEKVFSFFPDTPVRLLKDVFDALQLFDLVELLEKVKVHRSSLQLQRTLQEVRTLRKIDERPTTYHSNVAVLIVYYPKESAESTERLRTFFMDLNSDNNVTIIPGLPWYLRYSKIEDLLRQRNVSDKELKQLMGLRKTSDDEKLEALNKQRMLLEKELSEIESTEKVALETVERWIQNQGSFTFCAVFDFVGVLSDSEYSFMMEKLEILSDKDKLVLTLFDTWLTFEKLTETLLVSAFGWVPDKVPDAVGKIFKKRWQTLDLCSMMEELRRTVLEDILIVDSMSSSVRLKKLGDKDSA